MGETKRGPGRPKKTALEPQELTEIPLAEAGKVHKYYRLCRTPRLINDQFPGYQAVELDIVGTKVIAARRIEKPDMFELAQTKLIDHMDPRNEKPEAEADETE